MRRRSGERLAGAAGFAVLVVAILPPVDAAAHDVFFAHMGQHLGFFLVAPALVALARPARSLSPKLARRLARIRLSMGAMGVVTLAYAAVVWIWHWPVAYDAALQSTPVHLLEHASLLGAGLLFWTVVLEASSWRAGFAVVAVFVSALQMGALAALLVFAPDALYGHGAGPGEWGLTSLEDQQLGGAVMWGPGGGLMVLAGVLIFARWLRAEERRMELLEAVIP